MIDDLMKSTKTHEGFVNIVYKDSNGFDTIGFGTKLPLSKEESELILNYRSDNGIPNNGNIGTVGFGVALPLSKEECELLLKHRLTKKISELQDAKPFITEFPDEVQNVLYEMAYQMGVSGLLKFHKTWEYLQEWDFEKASDEMLDSKWARNDAPNRAENLSEIIRKTQTRVAIG